MSTVIEMVFEEARVAAQKAFTEHKPKPMVVGQAASLFSNEIVPGTEEYVADGVCGFAWATIKPARGPLVKWLKSRGIGDRGVYGGYTISSYEMIPNTWGSQSMEKKYAGVKAFCEVIRKELGVNITPYQRMD